MDWANDPTSLETVIDNIAELILNNERAALNAVDPIKEVDFEMEPTEALPFDP